ncbi:hypothetical protein [Thermincola potens]|uniref:hypothetical protein n=1 Tax=Thermincola potens TaxID=863643 RepID=UPI00031BF979|nr:hypothetical protein [Thermincola potens]
MEKVEPIRDPKKIEHLKKYLLGAGNMRNYALVVLGLNSALRISDILSLINIFSKAVKEKINPSPE